MTNKELLDKINVLYGDIDFSREDFKNPKCQFKLEKC